MVLPILLCLYYQRVQLHVTVCLHGGLILHSCFILSLVYRPTLSSAAKRGEDEEMVMMLKEKLPGDTSLHYYANQLR